MTDSTAGPVLVVAEAAGSALRPISLELATAGRKVAEGLGAPLVGFLAGSGVDQAARELAGAGFDRVLVTDAPHFAQYTTGAFTTAVARVVQDLEPAVVLIPGTTAGRDVAPRLAARLRTGLAADAIDLTVEEGALVAVRPVLGGRVQTAVRFSGMPMMATIRPGSFPRVEASGTDAPIESVAIEPSPEDLRVTVKGMAQEEAAGSAKLESADVIVSGGRGLKEPENFRLVEELAAVLDAAVGASRAVVDAGWRPHHEQVGQTGRTVAPRLYIAVGISGAVQHLVGMQGADYIVAINRDPDAPIFKIASFGIVGDLFEVVPAITAELRAALA